MGLLLLSFRSFCFYKSRKKSFILYVCLCVLVAQLCPTLCNPMDCNSTVSSDYGIFQARILEWVANSLLQGIFLTQGSNLGLLHYRHILYCLSHWGSPFYPSYILQTFSPLLRWSFPFLDGILWSMKGFTFDEVQFIYFFFCCSVFGVLSGALLSWPSSNVLPQGRQHSSDACSHKTIFVITDLLERFIQLSFPLDDKLQKFIHCVPSRVPAI